MNKAKIVFGKIKLDVKKPAQQKDNAGSSSSKAESATSGK